MYCENCGAKIPGDSKFCENCGARQRPLEQETKKEEPRNLGETMKFDPPTMKIEAPKTEEEYVKESEVNQVRPTRPRETSFSDGWSGEQEQVLGVSDYLKMQLLMAVPILNIVMLFVWGFGDNINMNKKNLAKVMLIFMAVSIAPFVITIIALIPLMISQGAI